MKREEETSEATSLPLPSLSSEERPHPSLLPSQSCLKRREEEEKPEECTCRGWACA
jgi:hypothetical protein